MNIKWVSTWVMMIVFAGGSSVIAASDSWNVDADGSYFSTANWAGGVVPGKSALSSDSTDVATFANTITAPRTVTLDSGNRNIGGFTFGSTGSSGHTLATSGPYAYYLTAGSVIQTLAGTGYHNDTISAGLNLYGNTTFANYATFHTGLKFTGNVTGRASSGTATLTLAGGSISGQNLLSGVVSDGPKGGNLAIVKNGPGTWTLSANNTFTGGMTVNQGTMRYYGTGTALGRGAITINNGATFNHANTSATIITNGMTANGDFSISGGAGTQWGGTMDLGGGTRTMTVKVNSDFDTVFSNGGLIKAGSSTLTLSAGSTYGGGTTVSEGTLVAAAAGALGTGSITNNATLTLQSASCLGADASLVLSSDCTLTLDYSGTATLAALSLDGGATYLDAGSYDAAALSSQGSGTYTGSGVLNVYVDEPPTISLFSVSSSEVVVEWTGSSSREYTLQQRSDLQSGAWSNIVENIAGLDATMYATDSVPVEVSFYRVLSD